MDSKPSQGEPPMPSQFRNLAACLALIVALTVLACGYYAPFNITGLVEQASSTTTILISGNVGARASSSFIVGNLSGMFILREGNTRTPGYCSSGFHPFEMRRR
jgi:hypothetical protein